MNIKKNIKTILNKITRKQRIAMLHPGRVGSTVVGSLLNQHPDFYWWGEPFEKLMNSGPMSLGEVKKVIRDSEQIAISKIYSFATKYPAGMHLSESCINMSIPDYIELLYELNYSKYILITRKNHLKRVVSILKGRKSGEWHRTQKATKDVKIYVPVENFDYGIEERASLIEYFKIMDRETQLIKDTIGGKPLLHIEYEPDIEEDPRKAYHKICEFAGIKSLTPEVKLQKTNPFPLKDLIENFDEVQAYFKGTPYFWMVNE